MPTPPLHGSEADALTCSDLIEGDTLDEKVLDGNNISICEPHGGDGDALIRLRAPRNTNNTSIMLYYCITGFIRPIEGTTSVMHQNWLGAGYPRFPAEVRQYF
jgi:hypothetical protein